MGCKTNYTRQSNLCDQTDHCGRFVPEVADQSVTTEFTEYPLSPIRDSSINYQINKRDSIAVMYPSVPISEDDGGAISMSGNLCGKVYRTVNCSDADRYYYDYVPNELSFDLMFSDRWFSYLYDTSDNAGHVGIACYYLEEETRASTTPSPGVDGEGNPIPGTTTTTGSIICHPCTSFSCTTSKTYLTYDGVDDLTGDPDAPHPTLFGIGTDSKKVVFSYNNRSAVQQNGCKDFEFSYDGVTYADAWNENDLEGIAYDSTQNPFTTGQDQLNDFKIFELDNGNATGLRLKISIDSIADVDATPGPTYSGVRWRIAEVMNAGSGYSANQVFALTYAYTKPDNTVVNLTMNLRIKTVGNIDVVQGGSNLGVLQTGDTLNGHTITRVFHTDLDNFPYHIAYVDGDGSNFAKNTQYTSSSNHTITAEAGYGIADRAILVGLYEFQDKSIQFTTADVSQVAPDVYNTLVQPDVDVTISNGKVNSVTINDGGSGWDNLKGDPVLTVIADQDSDGKLAEFEPTFTNGVLTAVRILSPGSGYKQNVESNQEDAPEDGDATHNTTPKLYISNVHLTRTRKEENPAYQPEEGKVLTDSLTKGAVKLDKSVEDQITEAFNPEEIIETTFPTPNLRLKLDDDRYRQETMPQKMYSKERVAEWKESSSPKYDITEKLNALDMPDEVKRELLDANEIDKNIIADISDTVLQEQIPEVKVFKETLVETVQGPFSDLPESSDYTKYMVRQFRADNSSSKTLNVTLSVKVSQKGCGHVTCSPTASTGGTETDGDGNTIVTGYGALTGPLGGGCRDWACSGKMIIQNDMTSATNTLGDAIEEYGNPFGTD